MYSYFHGVDPVCKVESGSEISMLGTFESLK